MSNTLWLAGWLAGGWLSPAWATQDDDDTPNDLDAGVFVDDEEPDGGPEYALLVDEVMPTRTLSWLSLSPPTVEIPILNQGEEWVLEVEAFGLDFVDSYEEGGYGLTYATETVAFSLSTASDQELDGQDLTVAIRAIRRDASGGTLSVYPLPFLYATRVGGQVVWGYQTTRLWPAAPGTGGQSHFTTWTGVTPSPDDPAEEVDEADYLAAPEPWIWVDFCVDIKAQFEDYMPRGGYADGLVADDYFYKRGKRHARGLEVVIKGRNGARVVGSNTKFLTWESHPAIGVGPGCGHAILETGETYDFDGVSRLLIDEIDVQILTNSLQLGTSSAGAVARIKYGFVVPTTTQPPYQWNLDSGGDPAWNVASAVGWALYRRRVPGMSHPDGVVFFTEDTSDCSNGVAACTDGHISSLDFTNVALPVARFPIVHELGHVVGYYANDRRDAAGSFLAVAPGAGTCVDLGPSHKPHSVEYSSAAAVEGWANYYHAVVFNDTTQNDCGSVVPGIDYNNDTVDPSRDTANFEALGDIIPMNCQGAVYWNAAPSEAIAGGWDDFDYYGQACLIQPNRSVETDWTRFFWSLDTAGAQPFASMAELWDRTDPHKWASADPTAPFPKKTPWERVEIGAGNLTPSIQSLVTSAGSDHGVDR